jgi:hypothetical protein
LRAEAAVFTPQDVTPSGTDEGVDFGMAAWKGFLEADCKTRSWSGDTASTAAPSPELNASLEGSSPSFSPYWGFEEASWNAAAAAALYGHPCFLPELALDESLAETVAASFAASAAAEPAFELSGLDDFQSSLAHFLAASTMDPTLAGLEALGLEEEDDDDDNQAALPPGLEPPPGLEGFGLESEEPLPPGLDGKVSVAALHAQLKGKKDCLPVGTTTAMLRNIPNKYSQLALVERLYQEGFRGQVDFVYLPIDFKNKCNVGYAFINFRNAEACARFAMEYHLCNSREKLPGFNSKKVCEVSPARFQGREENVRRLQASAVMSELIGNPEWLPMLFDEAGEAMEFPVPDSAKEVSATTSRSSRGRLSRKSKGQ